jgi:hypothetical protein
MTILWGVGDAKTSIFSDFYCLPKQVSAYGAHPGGNPDFPRGPRGSPVPDRGRDTYCYAPPAQSRYVRLSRIRLPPRVFDGLATSVRHAVCGPAHVTRLPDTEFGACFTGPHFPWPPPLAPSTPPLAAPASFVDFTATTTGTDFSRPFIISFGSSPSLCGPARRISARPNARSPKFRLVPFVRDRVFDHG